MERQRAEEAYSEVQLERNTLEVLVEKRTLEKIALEERLEAVTEEAEFLRSEMKERDEMLREGNQLVEAKETELDTSRHVCATPSGTARANASIRGR